MAPSRHRVIKILARAGYVSRGVIYLIVGGMALLAVFGQGGGTVGSKGALSKLMSTPYGTALLGVVAIGLVAYSIWRAIQAIKDVDGHGTDAKGIAIRLGMMVSCLTHLGLALFAVTLLFGIGTGNNGGGYNRWTGRLMAETYGRWLVGAVALAIAGAGLAQIAKAFRSNCLKHFKPEGRNKTWVVAVGRFGLASRGVAFLLIAGFLAYAAVTFDPDKAKGMAAVLQTVREQPFGPYLLGVLAGGLFSFGLYSMTEAMYRRIGVD